MHRIALKSLLSTVLSATVITLNHWYVLGPRAVALGAVLIVVPAGLLWWFRATKSPTAFGAYLLMSLWIVIGFGLVKGFWGITLPLFLGTLLATLSTSYPMPTLGSYGFEASGMLMFVGSIFVAYFALRLLEAKRAESPGAPVGHPTVQPVTLGLAIGVVGITVLTGAYVYRDRDRWRPPADGVVKIGVIVPTSGPYSVLGNSFVKAVELAREDLRDTRYRYELIPVDVGADPDGARTAVRRAVQEGKLDAIVGGISLFGQVTKPFATAARIPHTCVCTVSSIGDGSYNFTNIPSPDAEAARWVQEAQRRGIGSVALLTQSYPSIANHVKALKAEAARKGLRVVFEETFDASRTDFTPLITRARATSPDVYYVEALEPSLDLLAEQLSAANIHNVASVVAPSLSARPELFEGTWYTDSDLRDAGFRSRFERRYPGTRFATHMMPYAYDDFNMIVQAFEHGHNPAVYIRNLTRYEGAAGLVTRAPGSGNFQSTPTVWVMRNGRPAPAASIALRADTARTDRRNNE